MTANFAALLYLVAGVLFILALRGLSSPATSRQGNMFGMAGMAIAIVTTLGVAPAVELRRLAAGAARHGHRRRRRRGDRAPGADDGHAAAGRGFPFAGRLGRGAGGGGRALRAGGVRAGRARPYSGRKSC